MSSADAADPAVFAHLKHGESGEQGEFGEQGELAVLTDRLADLTRATPGVADLHGGVFGEVATYLPGRKVAGVRVEDDHVEIHVSVLYDQPVRATAEGVAARLEPVVGRPVHVTVDDVLLPGEVTPQEDTAPRPGTGATDTTSGARSTGSPHPSSSPQSCKETSS